VCASGVEFDQNGEVNERGGILAGKIFELSECFEGKSGEMGYFRGVGHWFILFYPILRL
jgi:hypothetical protein